MNTDNVKLKDEAYVSHPVNALWQAFLRWKNTTLGTTIVLMVLLIAVLLFCIVMALFARAPEGPPPSSTYSVNFWLQPEVLLALGIAALLITVLTLPFCIAVDYSFVSAQNNQRVGVGAALKRGYKRLFVAIGTYLLALLFILGGLVLLIVPGIYIALRLSYLNSIIANENLGVIDNIRRSFTLTKSNLWDIIGAGSAGVIVTSALSLIVTGAALLLNAAGIPSGLEGGIIIVLTLASLILSFVAAPVLYFRYHQSALEKAGQLKKDGTDKLNYILLVVALLLSGINNSGTPEGPPPALPGDTSKV